MSWLHYLAELGFYLCAIWIAVTAVVIVLATLAHVFHSPLQRLGNRIRD